MKKNLLLFVVLLILIAGFLIYLFYNNSISNQVIRLVRSMKYNISNTFSPSDQKLYSWAMEKKDLTFCLKMNDPTGKRKIRCLSDLAKNIKNPHLCDEILFHHWLAADSMDVNRCYQDITNSFNSISEKILICNESQLIDAKTTCLQNITDDYYKNGICSDLNLDDCIKKLSN